MIEPSALISLVLNGVSSKKAAAGMEATLRRANDFPSLLHAQLAGIALVPAGRTAADKVLDAYWADEVHVRDGKTYVKITDDRPDEPRGRPHVEIGTEIEVPNHKLKWDKSNPTGHGVVFLSRAGYVYCFVQPGGA